MLQLPVELKFMIVRQLTRDDLFNLLTVCKDLKAFVHPLFYEHMLFTKGGFTFPHAPHPYPLLDLPGLKVKAPVSSEEREGIMNRIRSVVIPAHRHDSCTGWRKLQGRDRLANNFEVLTIELALPSEDGVATCHKPVPCTDCDSCKADSGHHWEHPDDGSHPFPDCGFLDGLGDATAEKVIVKNFPALSYGVKAEYLPETVSSASEFVVVLEPHNWRSLYIDNYDEDFDGFYSDDPDDICPYGPGGATALMKMIPPDVSDLTMLFRTRSPDEEWSPGCKHHSSNWYEGPCPCGGIWLEDHDCGLSVTRRTKQKTCWQSAFWKDLARAIADSEARVTLVNYAAIIPDGVNRSEAVKALKSNRRHTVRKKLTSELRKAHESEEEFEARLADVRFMSMESWICSGAWEDVFKREELKGWFDHIAKMRKAQKAAAKKSETATPVVPKEDKPTNKPVQAEPAR